MFAVGSFHLMGCVDWEPMIQSAGWDPCPVEENHEWDYEWKDGCCGWRLLLQLLGGGGKC